MSEVAHSRSSWRLTMNLNSLTVNLDDVVDGLHDNGGWRWTSMMSTTTMSLDVDDRGRWTTLTTDDDDGCWWWPRL